MFFCRLYAARSHEGTHRAFPPLPLSTSSQSVCLFILSLPAHPSHTGRVRHPGKNVGLALTSCPPSAAALGGQ